MGGRDELIARIRSDGAQRVAAIDAERDRAVEDVRSRASAEIEELRRAAAEHLRHEMTQIVERARSEARLVRRNAELAARWRVIERVIDEAGKRFRQDPEYQQRLVALVRKHSADVGGVRVAAGDVAALRAAGIKAEAGAVTAGAVVSTGRRDLNLSLEAMAADVRETLVGDIARLLFGEGQTA